MSKEQELQQQLDELKKQMAERQPTVGLDQLKGLLEAVVSAARSPDPIQQKALDAQIEEERRRSLLAIELAKVEQEKQARRKASCTHKRYKDSGNPAPRDGQEGTNWTSGGQLLGDGDRAIWICTRCAWSAEFKVTSHQRSLIEQQGMLG